MSIRGRYKLARLPESLGQLVRLQKLDLLDCSVLTYLPESLGQLPALETLKLRFCHRLTRLPESLGQLAALRMLKLSDNSALIHHIPGHVPHEQGTLCVALDNGYVDGKRKGFLQNYRRTVLVLVLATRRKKIRLPSELLEVVLEAIRGNEPGTA